MCKDRFFILLISLLFNSTMAMAQNDTAIEEKTVKPVNAYTDTANYFNDLKAADKSKVGIRKVRKPDLERLRQDKAFWYTDKQREKLKAERNNPSFFAKLFRLRWFGILLWMIIIGSFVGAIVWFLAASHVSFFKKQPKQINAEASTIETENIFGINFEQELSKALQASNYRLAIRIIYLQTLKLLNDKAVIQYRQERTNGDYLMQLYGTSYYTAFFKLTRHFEYAWYGKFPVSAAGFEIVKQAYANLKSQLPR